MSDDFDETILNEEGLKKLFENLDLLDSELEDNFAANAGAVGGAVGGGALAFGALYGLGVTGISAVGITSGLAAAGAIVGGGMVAGIGVLAAPIAILAVGGYSYFQSKKRKRILALQRDCLAKAIEKQNAILKRLDNQSELTNDIIVELQSRNQMLIHVINKLKQKLEPV